MKNEINTQKVKMNFTTVKLTVNKCCWMVLLAQHFFYTSSYYSCIEITGVHRVVSESVSYSLLWSALNQVTNNWFARAFSFIRFLSLLPSLMSGIRFANRKKRLARCWCIESHESTRISKNWIQHINRWQFANMNFKIIYKTSKRWLDDTISFFTNAFEL